jgi:hypothetical protein
MYVVCVDATSQVGCADASAYVSLYVSLNVFLYVAAVKDSVIFLFFFASQES